MMYDVVFLDGPTITRISGRLSLIECDGVVITVVVETDGGAFFIPAARVIAWKEA